MKTVKCPSGARRFETETQAMLVWYRWRDMPWSCTLCHGWHLGSRRRPRR